MCVKIRSGSTRAFKLLEDVLHLAADVREEAVAEPVHDHVGSRAPREEHLRARPRLALPLALRAEHDPRHLELGLRAREREQRRPAADLDVVGVRAEQRGRGGAAASPPRARSWSTRAVRVATGSRRGARERGRSRRTRRAAACP